VKTHPAGRLFVYGSLRSKAQRNHPAAQEAYARLVAGAILEGKATISGRLYAPDWYPGLIPGVTGKVQGEVWRLEKPDLLAELDVYEGDAYVREAQPVTTNDGRQVTTWVYRYVADLSGVPLIASGDYLDGVRNR
jgi:gamma-glutamylcyclotransferase (GGCT)/AIG2-like uncharacterized protein YtfP